jgi:hypothetical protein
MNIFLISKSKFRKLSLNNFQYQKRIGSYRLYNFIGPTLFYIGKLLLFLNLGKGISFDGNPILKSEKGINLWMGGTNFKILKKYNNLKNNYVNMKSIFLRNEKYFQIFPFNINTYKIKKKINIVFVSEINITEDLSVLKIWKKNKVKLLKNFTMLDDIKFWKEFYFFNDKNKCFNYYKKIKNLLRLEILKKLNVRYKNLILVGNSWSKYNFNSFQDSYSPEIISRIYRGNICIDLGSKAGSLSLYPRSINIIESGGALVQLKQNDSEFIWEKSDLQKYFLFSNFKQLFFLIDKILKEKKIIRKMIENNRIKFKSSQLSTECQFRNFF